MSEMFSNAESGDDLSAWRCTVDAIFDEDIKSWESLNAIISFSLESNESGLFQYIVSKLESSQLVGILKLLSPDISRPKHDLNTEYLRAKILAGATDVAIHYVLNCGQPNDKDLQLLAQHLISSSISGSRYFETEDAKRNIVFSLLAPVEKLKCEGVLQLFENSSSSVVLTLGRLKLICERLFVELLQKASVESSIEVAPCLLAAHYLGIVHKALVSALRYHSAEYSIVCDSFAAIIQQFVCLAEVRKQLTLDAGEEVDIYVLPFDRKFSVNESSNIATSLFQLGYNNVAEELATHRYFREACDERALFTKYRGERKIADALDYLRLYLQQSSQDFRAALPRLGLNYGFLRDIAFNVLEAEFKQFLSHFTLHELKNFHQAVVKYKQGMRHQSTDIFHLQTHVIPSLKSELFLIRILENLLKNCEHNDASIFSKALNFKQLLFDAECGSMGECDVSKYGEIITFKEDRKADKLLGFTKDLKAFFESPQRAQRVAEFRDYIASLNVKIDSDETYDVVISQIMAGLQANLEHLEARNTSCNSHRHPHLKRCYG